MLATGEDGSYFCIAYGNPAPNIDWTYKGKIIPDVFDKFQMSTSSHGDKLLSNLVVMARSASSGELKCLVENESGGDSNTLVITITGEKLCQQMCHVIGEPFKERPKLSKLALVFKRLIFKQCLIYL